MASILVAAGSACQEKRIRDLQQMASRSPHHGPLSWIDSAAVTIAVQSHHAEQNLLECGDYVIAFVGYSSMQSLSGLQPSASQPVQALGSALNAPTPLIDVARQLDGGWSCIVYQRSTQQLWAVRDVIGCLPLFYRVLDSTLYLASDLTQINRVAATKPSLNESYFAEYAGFGDTVVTMEETFYQDVFRVLGGVLYSWSLFDGLRARQQIYWSQPEVDRACAESFDEANALVRQALFQAVQAAAANLPTCVSLSGGMDSSSIWAALAELERNGRRNAKRIAGSAIAVGYPTDESELIAENLRRNPGEALAMTIAPADLIAELDEVVAQSDLPPYSLMHGMAKLYAAMSQRGAQIELTGYGGDQLFKVPDYARAHMLRQLRFKSFFQGVQQSVSIHGYKPRYLLPWRLILKDVKLAWKPGVEIFRHQISTRSKLAEQWLWLEQARIERLQELSRSLGPLKALRQVILDGMRSGGEVDRFAGLAASQDIEVRHPYLSRTMIEATLRLPLEYHFQTGQQKGLLRAAMKPYLPEKIYRQKKIIYRDFLGETAHFADERDRIQQWQLLEQGFLDSCKMKEDWKSLPHSVNLAVFTYPLECFLRSLGRLDGPTR